MSSFDSTHNFLKHWKEQWNILLGLTKGVKYFHQVDMHSFLPLMFLYNNSVNQPKFFLAFYAPHFSFLRLIHRSLKKQIYFTFTSIIFDIIIYLNRVSTDSSLKKTKKNRKKKTREKRSKRTKAREVSAKFWNNYYFLYA